jgi:hypothetical protein
VTFSAQVDKPRKDCFMIESFDLVVFPAISVTLSLLFDLGSGAIRFAGVVKRVFYFSPIDKTKHPIYHYYLFNSS